MASNNTMKITARRAVAFPPRQSIHKRRVAAIALVCCLPSVPSIAEVINWPELPKTCFVSKRPANVEDVRKGCAAFLIGGPDKSDGKPLDIEIPQYAYRVDSVSGKKTPVILLQAEERSGTQVVGYSELGTSRIGATLLSEMQLLGTRKPR